MLSFEEETNCFAYAILVFLFLGGGKVALVSYLDPTDDMSHFLCRQALHCSWPPCWTGECCTERESMLLTKKTCFHLVAVLIINVCVCVCVL